MVISAAGKVRAAIIEAREIYFERRTTIIQMRKAISAGMVK